MNHDDYMVWKFGDAASTFAYGFMSPWQRSLLVSARAFCLDATHDITAYINTIMYTIVVHHEDTDRGVPVAYLITNSQSAALLTDWISGLKDVGVNFLKITINCSHTEASVIVFI